MQNVAHNSSATEHNYSFNENARESWTDIKETRKINFILVFSLCTLNLIFQK